MPELIYVLPAMEYILKQHLSYGSLCCRHFAKFKGRPAQKQTKHFVDLLGNTQLGEFAFYLLLNALQGSQILIKLSLYSIVSGVLVLLELWKKACTLVIDN